MSEIIITDERNKVNFMHRIGIAWPADMPDKETAEMTERTMPSFELIDLLTQECEMCEELNVTHSDCGSFTTLKFYFRTYKHSPQLNYSEWDLLDSWYCEKLMPLVVETLDRIAESSRGNTASAAAAEREYKRLQKYLKSKSVNC